MGLFILDYSADQNQLDAIKQIPTCSDIHEAQTILVIGGDGAMLKAINAYHQLEIPFVGIHQGTRGYLMNQTDDLVKFVQELDRIHYEPLWMLEAEAHCQSGIHKIYGFNDIWVERQTSQTLRMTLSIDGVEQPPLIVGDGILFSTPQGSTGYNLALRGKAITPGVPVLQVTPMSCVVNKAPLGSFFLSHESTVAVTFHQTTKRPGELNHDGFFIKDDPVEALCVKKSSHSVKVGFNQQHSLLSRVLAWQLHF